VAKHIAVAGKGGTGKTTVASFVVRYLVEERKGSILAVDADPNSNLNEALGVEVAHTISSVLVDIKKNKVPAGMSKEIYMDMMLHKALIETEAFDLLVMGGPQGPGCYCYPNELLKRKMEVMDKNYDYVVIDNEAGMEHISRQTIENVDVMLVISDPTAKGVRSAVRIYELAKSLNIKIGKAYLVITKTDDPEPLKEEFKKSGLEFLGVIPYDPLVAEYDLQGKPLIQLPEESVAWSAARKLFEEIQL
jgi:CO dehydrogenase maturation factor